MNFPKDLFLKLLYYLVCPLLLISYLLEPFTSDVRIYLGAAKVTALTPGFPMSLDAVWETRYVGHRFLYYILNLLDPFTGWAYSIWMKLIVAVVMIVILYYFSKRVAETMQVSFHYPFIVGYLGLFAVNNFVILSSESFAVVAGMLMLTVILDDRIWVRYLSGLLILPLLILKGLTILVALVVILAVILLVPDYKVRFYQASVISLPIVGISILAIVLYFPHFISDIFLLGQIVRLGSLDVWHIIQYLFEYSMGVVGFIPMIVVGVFMIFFLLSVTTKLHIRDLRLLLAMWLVGLVYVLFVSEFFYYHYYIMLIPTILTTCYFLKVYTFRDRAFAAIILLVLVIFAGVVSGWSLGLAFKGYTHWNDIDSDAAIISELYDLTDQPVTLYLDDGEASYYFPTISACRYVAALPYQRHTPVYDMSKSPEYWEERSCILNYTGNYILIKPVWFKLNATTHTEVVDKLTAEYTRVYTSTWDVYQRKTTS